MTDFHQGSDGVEPGIQLPEGEIPSRDFQVIDKERGAEHARGGQAQKIDGDFGGYGEGVLFFGTDDNGHQFQLRRAGTRLLHWFWRSSKDYEKKCISGLARRIEGRERDDFDAKRDSVRNAIFLQHAF